MINTLKIIESDIEDTKKKYEGTVTYEELTAFEYTDDEETFQKSMNAWHSLANRFVADGNNAVDYDTIESELGGMRNTRSISYQEDSVHNYEAFFQAIRDAGLGKHIRTQTQFWIVEQESHFVYLILSTSTILFVRKFDFES